MAKSQLYQLVSKSFFSQRKYCSAQSTENVINGKIFNKDSYTNITPRIISYLDRNLHNQKEHPLCLMKERLIKFFYSRFKNKKGNPEFSVFDNLSPIVTTTQNFDSLLIPKDHPSRAKTDCYYVNKDWLLRAHMTAHQSSLIQMGLNNFLMIGDVYRRDKIDVTHYPVFHQIDGVRLRTPQELFAEQDDGVIDFKVKEKEIFERTKEKQEVYTLTATKLIESELKKTLEDLSKSVFGNDIQYRWVEAVFPFTHPSWELEIMLNNDTWVEMLGCGVIEHEILENAGCSNRIGWAFGLGLDRLAMAYYSIPDIRIMWSKDLGFLHQFEGKTWADKVTFKPFSVFPACPFDLSFWIEKDFQENDFFDFIREFGDNVIEHVKLVDTFRHPITGKESRCYRLHYRSMEKTLTREEVNVFHNNLIKNLSQRFSVQIR